MSSAKTNLCINCQKPLKGEYCHGCGEKVISEKDFTIKNIFSQAIDIFTHVDSKLFKSFRWLLLKPGMLSVSYVKGLRKPFMKPFQIFILCNILFFIFLSDFDIFRKPSHYWFKSEADYGFNIHEIVTLKSLEGNISIDELALNYDHKSNSITKGFVVIFIPAIGFFLSLLHYKMKMQFGKHVIFATHLFSSILLIMVLWTNLLRLYPYDLSNQFFVIPILLSSFVLLLISVKKFYYNSWGLTILKTIITIILVIIFMEFYRTLISLVVLHSI